MGYPASLTRLHSFLYTFYGEVSYKVVIVIVVVVVGVVVVHVVAVVEVKKLE